jgi:CO/xanthine dehydrogenase FAD-binding subunit
VAAHPWRLSAVEEAITGRDASEETAAMAGEMAIQGAVSLRYNAYKLPLMRNLVRRSVRAAQEA